MRLALLTNPNPCSSYLLHTYMCP
uniref:Uncharacterized protein n=1 Tax=Arundo donax TaxID=35708 RepID=A0A0A8YU62_ARUDO